MNAISKRHYTKPQTKNGVPLFEYTIMDYIRKSGWGHLSLADISTGLKIDYEYSTRICTRLVREEKLSQFKQGRKVFYSITK